MYTDPAQFPQGGASSAPTNSNQSSYVDDYSPPSMTTPAVTSTPPPVSAAATGQATASAQAALDELEKLLAEIKAKNASLQTNSTPTASAPMSSSSTPTFHPSSAPVFTSTPASTSSPQPVSPPPWELPKHDPDVKPDHPLYDDKPFTADTMSSSAVQSTSAESESLEDQNIFFLLGVTDGTDDQKESFLDELQQTIWEDFVDHDVKLLLTSEEYADFEKEKAGATGTSPEAQEKLMAYLEQKIPDLEDILLEKALELKADMVRERIAGLREYHAGKTDVLAKLDEAEQLTTQNKWHASATLLNSLPK